MISNSLRIWYDKRKRVEVHVYYLPRFILFRITAKDNRLPPKTLTIILNNCKNLLMLSLNRQLTQELKCPASDWKRIFLKEYVKLFEYNILPLTDQSVKMYFQGVDFLK